MKGIIPFLFSIVVLVSCSGNKQVSSGVGQYVDPFIGTTYTGHTFPGAAGSTNGLHWLGLLCRVSL